MDNLLDWLISKSDENIGFLILIIGYFLINKSAKVREWWALIKTIVGDVVRFLPFVKSKSKSIKDDLKSSITKDAELEFMIDAFRSSLGADRAVVYGFENGDRWLGVDKSKKKMSLVLEVLKSIKTPSLTGFYKDRLQGIPATQVAWFLDRIIKGQYRFLDTKEVVEHHVFTAKWYEENDVKSVIGVPIYSKEGHLTLIAVYEWVGEVANMEEWPEALKDKTSDELYAFFVDQHNDVSAFI